MDLTRRRLLAAGSFASVAAIAGCLDEAATDDPGAGDSTNDDDDGEENGDEENDGSDGETTDGSGSDADDDDDGEDAETTDDDDDDDTTDDGDETTYAIDDYDSRPYDDDRHFEETTAEAMFGAEEAKNTLELEAQTEETRDTLETYIEEIDFDRSVLLALHTRGPNLCYEFQLGEVDVDDANLRVTAAAVDGSDADEGCAEAEAELSMLLRVTFEDGVPGGGSITITDGWGNDHGLGYATASEGAEGSDSGE